MTIDPWLLSKLACPIDKRPLRVVGDRLVSEAGREYPIVEGVPVLIDRSIPQLQDTTDKATARTREFTEKANEARAKGEVAVDPYVQQEIVGTHGRLYNAVEGRLKQYPIPAFPAGPGNGRAVLDIGCNWGRWLVAAARAGFKPVGIDPGLDSLLAAKRVAKDLGVEIHVVNAGGQTLPFRDGCFDLVHSFSVLQHLPKPDVHRTLAEMGRVLVPGGKSIVQMAGKWGPLMMYHQIRRSQEGPFEGFDNFKVRFWSVGELRKAFESTIGPTKIEPHAFFTLNPITTDLEMLPLRARAVVWASMGLTAVARAIPPLKHVADSVWVYSDRPGSAPARSS